MTGAGPLGRNLVIGLIWAGMVTAPGAYAQPGIQEDEAAWSARGAEITRPFKKELKAALMSAMADIDAEAETEAFFADWGQITTADFNCDGTVDVDDWLIVISQDPLDVQAFLDVIANWGQGSDYDLNCDGVVNTADYLLLLSDMASSIGNDATETR